MQSESVTTKHAETFARTNSMRYRLEPAIIVLLTITAAIVVLWIIPKGLDRDAERDEQNCHDYWEMRSGAPEDRYGN